MPPRLARLLAIVAVVVLVVGAFALRSALSDDDDEGVTTGSGSSSGTEPRDLDDGPFHVLCDEDLGDAACEALEASDDVDEVRVVRRNQVASLVSDPEGGGWDAWLTLDPMPAVLDSERGRAEPPLTDPEAVLGVTSSTLAVLTHRDSSLECAEPITWPCLTDPAADDVAVGSPSTSVGAISLAAGAAELMGTTDFGRDQFDADPASDELEDLLDDVPATSGATTAAQTGAMVQPGPTSAALTYAGLADIRADTAQGQGRGLRTVALRPEVTIGVVLAGLGDHGLAATRALEGLVTGQTVIDALAEAGWDGPPKMSTGLPEPDVIYAILEELS